MPVSTDDLADLTLEQKVRLLTGQNHCTTHAVAEAGIPRISLADGPHGVRPPDAEAEYPGVQTLPATCFPPAAGVGSS